MYVSRKTVSTSSRMGSVWVSIVPPPCVITYGSSEGESPRIGAARPGHSRRHIAEGQTIFGIGKGQRSSRSVVSEGAISSRFLRRETLRNESFTHSLFGPFYPIVRSFRSAKAI